jgi:hypothetical protein
MLSSRCTTTLRAVITLCAIGFVSACDSSGSNAAPEEGEKSGTDAAGGAGGEAVDDAAGLGGAGPSPGAQHLVEKKRGALFTITSGDLVMDIDAKAGGRVTGLQISGLETLVQEGDAAEYGSVFWPSPQSTWGWPPPAEIDSLPYEATVKGDTLTLVSTEVATLGITVTKVFSATARGIAITYFISNVGRAAISLAPWEITRVASGLAYYPTGPDGLLESSTLTPIHERSHSWYAHSGEAAQSSSKSFEDGADGWIAFVATANSGLGGALVVKKFDDVDTAACAAGEAEIEVYGDATGDYFEVEQQGALVDVGPGESLSWRVEWLGRLLSEDLVILPGSEALIEAATSLL